MCLWHVCLRPRYRRVNTVSSKVQFHHLSCVLSAHRLRFEMFTKFIKCSLTIGAALFCSIYLLSQEIKAATVVA